MIDFLTEVGQSCDSQRQEWVLFADAIGLSQAVEDSERSAPAWRDAEHARRAASTATTRRS